MIRRLALLVLLAAGPALAEPAVLADSVVSLAGKAAPLPGTGWRILAEAAAGEGGLQLAILARTAPGALTALAILRANGAPRRAIHPLAWDCTRRDSYFATIRYDTPVDGYCEFGNLMLPDWQATEGAWGRAATGLRAEMPSLPEAMLEVGAQARNLAHAIDIRLYFPASGPGAGAGDGAGGGAGGGDWSSHPLSPRTAGAPAVVLAAAQLAAFAGMLQPELEAGLRGRLPPEAPPLPEPGDLAALGERRRLLLEGRLAAAGLPAAARAVLLDAPEAPEVQGWSLQQRSLAKVVTYRLASTLDTLLVSWLVTGSAAQTFGFAGANAVLKPMLAYVNELAWASSGVGRPRAALGPVELGAIGQDRAR